jgi:hypothetical protein
VGKERDTNKRKKQQSLLGYAENRRMIMKLSFTCNPYESNYEKFVRGIFEEECKTNLTWKKFKPLSESVCPSPCSRCEKNKAIKIKDVIFNDPATIVFWNDGTKTVVKAENEPFDREKGLAMAISKKFLGNKGNYFQTFKKFIKEED